MAVDSIYVCDTGVVGTLCNLYLYKTAIPLKSQWRNMKQSALFFHSPCHNLNNNKHVPSHFWNICCLLKLKIRYAVSNSVHNLCLLLTSTSTFCCVWTLWHCCEQFLVLLIYQKHPFFNGAQLQAAIHLLFMWSKMQCYTTAALIQLVVAI